jgi:hypothetical protein
VFVVVVVVMVLTSMPPVNPVVPLRISAPKIDLAVNWPSRLRVSVRLP